MVCDNMIIIKSLQEISSISESFLNIYQYIKLVQNHLMVLYMKMCNDEVGLKLYAFIDEDNLDHLSELNTKDFQYLVIFKSSFFILKQKTNFLTLFQQAQL